MLFNKIKKDLFSYRQNKEYIENELLKNDQFSKTGFSIETVDLIDIPMSLTIYIFGVRKPVTNFDHVIGYHAAYTYPLVKITDINDEEIYFIVNGVFYRKRKLHYTENDDIYFTFKGQKFYLNDCLKV
jgi:hypothetical protein